MPILGSSAPNAGPDDVARLRRELLRLDPWSFWAVDLQPGSAVPFAVLGATGAFVAAPCGLEGYLVAEGRKLLVDGRPVIGFRELRKAAKALRGKLISIAAATREVTPLLCLTKAVAGAPREVRGVRVVRPEDVVPEITRRDRIMDPSTAERLAQRLGTVLVDRLQRPDDEP